MKAMMLETMNAQAAPVGRLKARLVLVMLVLLLAWGMWRPLPRHGSDAVDARTDSALYSAIAERVTRGEGYYSAAGDELRDRGYPTGSVFNWRLPTLTLILAGGRPLSMSLLLVLVVAVIAGTVLLFRPMAPEVMIFAVLMQVGAAASAFNPLAFVLHETWAGLCIALSALLYAIGRPLPAALAAVAGCFIRELVAPYALLCAAMAVWHRQNREVLVYAVGGVMWLSYYGVHATFATASMTADALQHPSWIQWGGPRFVLATIGFGGWLYVLPVWASAIAAALLVASVWAPVRAQHAKAAALTYPMLFMVVGQQFNQYWGWLLAPVWACAYGLGLAGLVRLTKSAVPRSDRVRRSQPRSRPPVSADVSVPDRPEE